MAGFVFDNNASSSVELDRKVASPRSTGLDTLVAPSNLGCNLREPSVSIARSFSSVLKAFKLVTTNYRKQGYTEVPQGTLHFDPRLITESGTILAMFSGTDILGTLSILKYSRFGLPCSSVNNFKVKIDELSNQGRSLAELTHFAMNTSKEISQRSPIPLFNQAILLAKNAGVDTLVCVVHPDHLKFWKYVVGFTTLSDSLPCSHVQNNPGVLIKLDIATSLNRDEQSRLIRRHLKPEALLPTPDCDSPLSKDDIRSLLALAPQMRAAWRRKPQEEIPLILRDVLWDIRR